MSTLSRRRFVNLMGSVGASAAVYQITAAAGLTSGPAGAAVEAGSSDAPAFKTALELARMIREKEISSVELTQYFIDRIERFNEQLNAIIVRDFDRSLAAAREADAALMRGALKVPLHGLPMTIKESYNIAGLPTTWGIPELAQNIAASDAAVVTRFKSAGRSRFCSQNRRTRS